MTNIPAALDALHQDKIIAYPTEAVFGLGCDYRSETAVRQLLNLKQRPIEKGLILIAANWQQVAHLVAADLTTALLEKALQTWPGPVTWTFPASEQAPAWICGAHKSIALRISAHPTVQALCQQAGIALVSTSANPAQLPPAQTANEVSAYFTAEQVSVIVEGTVGDLAKPTPIYDIRSGLVIRE